MIGPTAAQPLRGTRVLDLSRLLPGPYCTLLLSDLGAEVVKVEDPATGDYLRYMPPLQDGVGCMFLALNRGKRSVALSLKAEAGQRALLRLAATADVFVESFRPGVAKRLGCGYDAIASVRPDIVYCSISGYGQLGPYAARAGHDINYIALAGLLGQNGSREGAPVIPNFQAADIAGGSWTAATRILAALYARAITGNGAYLDVSMTEGVSSLVAAAAANVMGGAPEPRRGDEPLCGGNACYNVYPTKDGQFMALGALEPKFWQGFCAAVGRPDWIPRQFEIGELGFQLKQDVASVFLTRTRAEWEDFFAPLDVCCEPILSLREAVSHPAVNRGAPTGRLEMRGSHPTPLRATNAGDVAQVAPRLGEHTAEVFREAGFTDEEIQRL